MHNKALDPSGLSKLAATAFVLAVIVGCYLRLEDRINTIDNKISDIRVDTAEIKGILRKK